MICSTLRRPSIRSARSRAGGQQHADLFEERVEQRPARAAPEMMLVQGVRRLDAVADGDVADHAALAGWR
jgi:hypothetical protein